MSAKSTTVKYLNRCISDSVLGCGGTNVYAQDQRLASQHGNEDWFRVIRARTLRGELQGKSLDTGRWFHIRQYQVR